jgi:hypothetical protein
MAATFRGRHFFEKFPHFPLPFTFFLLLRLKNGIN